MFAINVPNFPKLVPNAAIVEMPPDVIEIPATPVNENVVSVSSTNVTPNEQTVAVEENVTSENQKSQQPDVQTNNQEQSQQSQTVQQPVTQKKTKTSTIVIIAVAVALAMFIIFFVLPMIKSTKSTLEIFDQAKVNTFVTEIQHAMDEAKQSFMSDAMESPGRGIVYSNMKDVNNPTAKEIKEEAENKLLYTNNRVFDKCEVAVSILKFERKFIK